MVAVIREISTDVELTSPLFDLYSPCMKGELSMKRDFSYIVLILLFSWLLPALGHTGCPEYTFIKIADTVTPVPGGDGSFFESVSLSLPAVNGLRVAFRGEGGGEDGVFVGDGKTLNPVAVVGDPISGGGTINTIFDDFAYSGGVVNIIATPLGGDRGIYSTSATGLSKIVEFGEPAPSGGTFSTIFFVSRQGGNLAFQANITSGPGFVGVFTRIAGANELVVDSTTVIPESAPTTFSGFSDPDISGQNVAFKGGFGALTGVYARIDGLLKKVADINDTEPGSVESFTTVSIPVISGRQVAFRGVGGISGIYVGDGGPLTVIAQTGDPAPGGGTFSGFGPFVATDGEEVAFSGNGSGFNGLFVSGRFGLCRVIDTNDALETKDVTQLSMGRDSYSLGALGFLAVFSDGSRGIYLAKAPGRFPTGALFLLLDE